MIDEMLDLSLIALARLIQLESASGGPSQGEMRVHPTPNRPAVGPVGHTAFRTGGVRQHGSEAPLDVRDGCKFSIDDKTS